MTGTLLLDLDGTLLVNSISRFLPAYLQAVGQFMADLVPPDRLISALMAGTARMVENRQPDRTLKTVFEAYFFPELGINPVVFNRRADDFYRQVYPALSKVTAQKPDAIDFIQQANARGLQLVIATMPVFPRVAIQERLRWAGFPPEETSFRLVTSYENMHFSKPKPEYYAEILAFLGWPEGMTVSIGNDMQQDLLPSQAVGLPVFWTDPEERDQHNLPVESQIPNGSLADTWEWIISAPPDRLTPNFEAILDSLVFLRATPAALLSWSEKIPPDQWNQPPPVEAWTLGEIVCHLRDIEREVNLPRLQKMLTTKSPLLPGLDTDRWARERNYRQENARAALAEFVSARLELLNLLESLAPEDYQRSARHTILGKTTIREQIRIAAAHERLHLREFARTASRHPA
jgi:FMN phosphatase YigB (HAD superfamily)